MNNDGEKRTCGKCGAVYYNPDDMHEHWELVHHAKDTANAVGATISEYANIIKEAQRNVETMDVRGEIKYVIDAKEHAILDEIYAKTNVSDPINPSHYKQGSVECVDAIKSALTPEEFRGYCKGNIIKYVWREREKGQDESLSKANWYINKVLEKNK